MMGRTCWLWCLFLPSALGVDNSFDYSLQTDVATDFLHLALDIKDMRTSDFDTKKGIYENGRHASFSLASLSLSAQQNWRDVPVYILSKDAFEDLGEHYEEDVSGRFDNQPVEEYANTLVEDLFSLEVSKIEGTAAVVFNILMDYFGYLWKTLKSCQQRIDSTTILASLDVSVALYIGESQVRRETQSGYLLYNMAQFSGAQFGQDTGDGESNVNTETLRLLLELQSNIQNGFCRTDDGLKTVQRNIRLLYQNAYIVLLQMLLHHIQDTIENRTPSDFVEVYSLAVLPVIYACDRGAYDTLVNLTVAEDITEQSRNDVLATLQKSFACFGISCHDVGEYLDGLIPACIDPNASADLPYPGLAGYIPKSDVRDLSYLDRDLRHMKSFMEFGSWPAAIDYYNMGWNSDIYSLKGLASGEYPWTESEEYLAYETFYKSSSHVNGIGFANDLIHNALAGVAHFADIDDKNRVGVVIGAVQNMAFYLGIRGQIFASIEACDAKQSDVAISHWDSAAALFFGSSEGPVEGGQAGGQSLFAASKQFCGDFGTCEPVGSVAGTVLLASFDAGSKAIDDCEVLRTIDREKISINLMVILIQGLLYYTYKAAENSVDGARGYLAAYTVSLLPFLDPVIENSGEQTLTQGLDFTKQSDVTAMFDLVRGALPALGIDCASVGKLDIRGTKVGVCSADVPPPQVIPNSQGTSTVAPAATNAPAPGSVSGGSPTSNPMTLAWGRYPFVQEDLAVKDSLFTLDIRDMWFSDTPSAARRIYEEPSTHATTGLSGTPLIRSLQDFSTEASLLMSQDPAYNFFRVALFEDSSFDTNATGTKNGWPYGDAVEGLALGEANGNNAQLGSEAVIVMEIWMMIVHRLYKVAKSCEQDVNSPEVVDSAVGLWIGQEQKEGDASSGWSMYSLAQEADEYYGSTQSGETQVNTLLMQQFVSAQRLARTCAGNAKDTATLRSLVDDMVKNLSLPLLRHLLFHMSDNNFAYVELYALSFIPLTISVDELAFEYLRNGLFEGFNWDTSLDTELLELLGKTLHAMRFTCADLGNTSNANESLRGLVSLLCDEINQTYETSYLAAYEATTDVKELARIDLDILQIDLFMRAKAYDLALGVFQNGRNSRKSDGTFNTLQQLTSIEQESSTQLYDIHKSYFGVNAYSNNVILEAMQLPASSRYVGSSRLQRAKAVHSTLSTMLMYVQIVSKLRSAVDICKLPSNSGVTPQGKVDEAVALFVGSIEGPYSGGSTLQSGQMMYELAKDMCSYFNKCDSHGDSEANVNLQYAFSSMKEALDSDNCAAAESILEENILNVLPVPIIQGTLYFADQNKGKVIDTSSTDFVEGNLLPETILPEIAAVNQTSAAIIFDNTDFAVGDPSVRQGTQAVFDAFSAVLDNLGIDCSLVGTLEASGMSLCSSTKNAPVPQTPTNLGEDLYVSNTYVQDRANIALDIKDMQESLLTGRIGTAQLIYLEGRNSEIYDAMGKAIDYRSLSSFSTKAATTMEYNPLYQIAVHALRDNKGEYMNADATQYADSVVKDMFVAGAESNNRPLAAEAAVALNLWMELANELFQTVRLCKNGILSDDDGIHSVDEAAAYWIGDGQIAGDGDQGHLLYALAESMSDKFSPMTAGQSTTNSIVLRLLHEIKLEISVSNGCRGNSGTHRRISRMVDKVTSQMFIVHIQALIHYLREDDRDRVRIYSHAVVPLISGCNRSSFQYLKERLLHAEYLRSEVDNVISAIRSTLVCFDLKCEDIGIHSSESDNVCTDRQGIIPIAGYRPANDVSAYAKIDLDIKQIDILMAMKAYEAASDMYSFGKHVSLGSDGTALSLEQFATTSGRSVVPQYDIYRGFYDDEDYANAIVLGAFDGNLSDSTRKAVVIKTSQSMIMYMSALQEMHEAVSACSTANYGPSSSAALSWDKAAAYLIGHLEGSEEGGSDEGELLFALSKRLCVEFGTCSSSEAERSSRTSDRIETLLYSGRGAIGGGSCGELRKVVTEIEPLMRIPLLQGLLSAAGALTQPHTKDKDGVQAEAYVFAQSILPLIAKVNGKAAKTIQKNFPLTGNAMSDGIHSVASTFSRVLSDLDVDCTDIGSGSVIDPCTGSVKATTKDKWLLAVFVILGCVTFFAIFILLRSKRIKAEDSPAFVRSEGELNHTTELLAKLGDGDDTPTCTIENDASYPMLENSVAIDDEAYADAIQQALKEGELKVV